MRLATVTLLLFFAANQATAVDRPDVLFIAVDDLNDMVGFLKSHPGVKTPNLDRLAQRGVSFTNAHCAAPACGPSRTAVMTGLRPSRTGVYFNRDDWRTNRIAGNATTIPDAFKNAGYTTRGGGKLYHAHSLNRQAFTGFIDSEPWDQFFPSKKQQMPFEVTPKKWPVNSTKQFYRGYFDWAPLRINQDEMADAKVVSWASTQLAMQHHRPLFLAVGIYRPHVPWWTPQMYFDQHPLDKIKLPEIRKDDLDDIPSGGAKLSRRKWQQWLVENKQWKKAVQGYLASMTFADAMIGRLLDALDKGPHAGNTIIVLWSDHGYHLGHKQHWEKFALWEQATHVPLLFVDTRKNKTTITPGRSSQPASLLDVFPTLADLCGLNKPKQLDGKTLMPYLKDPKREPFGAVVTTHGFKNHAVRNESWRYIQYADGTEELYDHRKDPNEFENLAGVAKHADVKTSLKRFVPKNNHAPSVSKK